MLELFVYTIKLEGNDMAALSLLPPDIVQQYGLPTEAVIGEVDHRHPDMTPEHFTPNDKFLDLLSGVIRAHAPRLESIQKQVAKIDNGPVYVVDRRSANQGERPPFEDVIGWFGVRNGELQLDSWNPNPNYKLLTNAGPIELESALEPHLVDAVWASLSNLD